MNTTKIRKLVSRAERSIAKNRKGAEQKQNRAEERGRKEKSKEKNRAERRTDAEKQCFGFARTSVTTV